MTNYSSAWPAAARPRRRHRASPRPRLLHCLGMDWHSYVLEPLAVQFELIAYRLPGHRDTPLPKAPYAPQLTIA